MDSTTLGSEKCVFFGLSCYHSGLSYFLVEFAVLTLDPTTKKPKAKIYKPTEIDILLQKEGLAKKDDDNAMTS